MAKQVATSTLRIEGLTLAEGIYYSTPANVPDPDLIPDQFAFVAQTSVSKDSTRTSAAVTVAGLDQAILFTASGGTIDKNNDGNFLSAQSLNTGDTMRARHTASAFSGTRVDTVVTGGGISATFSSTTATEDGENEIDAANFPLELIFPRAAGTRPSTDTVAGTATPNVAANHPGLRAYPGLRYRVKVAYIGGSLPLTFSLTNAPTGMTIDTDGLITWEAPATTSTPSITITDAEGVSITEPFTVTVSTTGFKFVDGRAGVGDDTTGTGSAAAPWRTWSKMQTASSAGDITYFRNADGATVYTTNLAHNNAGGWVSDFNPVGNWKRMELNAATRSVWWRGYPGDAQVIIDGGYVQAVTQGNLIRIQGSAANPVGMEDLKFQNYYHMCMQIVVGGNHYDIFRNVEFDNVAQAINGANSSCIDSLSSVGSAPRFYVMYQDMYVHDCMTGGYKIYWQHKSTVDNCVFEDCGGNANAITGRGSDYTAGGPDHKAVCGRFEVRYSTYSNHPTDAPAASGGVPDGNNGANEDSGFGGNMNSGTVAAAIPTQGEVRYCRLGHFDRPGLRVVNMNNFGSGVSGGAGTEAGPIYVYRCTGVGRWNVENSDIGGDFSFYKNIIINDTGTEPNDRITTSGGNPGAGSRTQIVLGTAADANLNYAVAAAEDIVIDATSFELIGTYRDDYLGKKGWEIP
jgi:hypothetical protein